MALGSNLGDREAAIRSAIEALDRSTGVAVTAVSSIIETEPVGGPAQGRFLNAVVELKTTLDPRRLLQTCLIIEASHGRIRDRQKRWGPRTLDLDLLLHGDAVIDEPELTVPHPRMIERAFVIDPLAELAPELAHPVLGRSIRQLRDRLKPETSSPHGHELAGSFQQPPANDRPAELSRPDADAIEER